jgi:hypothetical protein
MTSRLAWLDHSESQRQRMMEVVGLFRERNTIDDLGLGSIRDTFSDALFPGTSTLHTRTKYLLFVPWIFQSLAKRNAKSSQNLAGELREREVQLSLALQAGGESVGVVGREAGARLKQFPSMTYWGALGRYAIRSTPATRQQILERLRRAAPRTSARTKLRGEAEEYTELFDWHANLPSPEADFLESATFDLCAEQGAYLEDRIQQSNPNSYLAFLILNAVDVSASDYPWDVAQHSDASPAVLRMVEAAAAFSHAMHGAQLLYHVLVAEQLAAAAGPSAERVDVDAYRDAYLQWADQRMERAPDALDDLPEFWATLRSVNPSIGPNVRTFVESWVGLVQQSDPRGLATSALAADLIRTRERSMKRNLARLSNRARLDTFAADPNAGPLGFRWGSARTVIGDLAAARSNA